MLMTAAHTRIRSVDGVIQSLSAVGGNAIPANAAVTAGDFRSAPGRWSWSFCPHSVLATFRSRWTSFAAMGAQRAREVKSGYTGLASRVKGHQSAFCGV